MTTFSQLVDDVVAETRRPDLRAQIIEYLNQTIREVHFDPKTNGMLLYGANLIESQLTSNLEVGFGWDIPDVGLFQGLATVRYDSIHTRDDNTRYPPEKTPGRGMANLERYYYRAGGSFHFSGFGGLNALIAIAYYQYPRRLKYYAAGARPGEFDTDMGWTYADAFDSTDALRLAAQMFTTNWVLMRWRDVIAEGLRAKIYKRLSDTERARTCFSLFTQLRMGLATGESAKLGGYA